MAGQKINPFLHQKRSGQDLIGFDLDDEHLRLVYARVNAVRREVVALLSHEVRGMSDADVASFLKQTLDSWRIKNPQMLMTVPLHSIITRAIEVPSVDDEEIREIVNLQASRHTPYSRAEIIVDWLKIGTIRQSYSKILLVIVPKEVVSRQEKILAMVGLDFEKVLFPSEGIYMALGKIMSGESRGKATGFVYLDSNFTNFTVVNDQNILFVRSLRIGTTALNDDREAVIERFQDELAKSLEAYQADEVGPAIGRVVVIGAGADTQDFDSVLTDVFHTPIQHQVYYNTFSSTAVARKMAESSKRVSFFHVIAPVLLYDKVRIDLTTDEKKLRRQISQRMSQLFQTGILISILLVIFVVFILIKLHFKELYLQGLEKRYNPVIQDADGIEKANAKTKVIKEYLLTRGKSLTTLVGTYDSIPPEVKIISLKYDSRTRFIIKGTSSNMASVFNFVTNLGKSKAYKKVELKYYTNREEGGEQLTDFEIACGIGNE